MSGIPRVSQYHRGLPVFCSQPSRRRRHNAVMVAAAQGAPEIRLITSDVDGTLLNSKQELTAGVEHAVKLARSVGVPLVVATGKAPGCAWTKSVLPRLGPPSPGVFMQGLLVYNAQGDLIHSRSMERAVIDTCIDFASQNGLTLAAYSTSRIVTEQTDEHTDRLLFYGEPTPEPVGPLRDFLNAPGAAGFQKLILMQTEERIQEIRPLAIAALGDSATLTTALPGMLEVLPPGASKGAGVACLLKELGMGPQHLMAIGDGENDVEMLQMAAVGVAVGNAGAPAKAAADVTLEFSNNQDAVAHAIERFVLAPRGLSMHN
ncbi:probable sugar phosphatase YidA [Coccomyxa sp. Obi]|nr:probable sugar phosphatase YidA [Coccomyxa sp. Obi]